MTGKDDVYADEGPEGKKKSSMMYPLGKLVVMFVKLERGMSTAAVGCQYGVNESTVLFIKDKEDRMRGSIKTHAP